MRLTLRTLLAYMDDILDPADHEELGRKIESSEFATELIHRSRDTVRRLRLGAPDVVSSDSDDVLGDSSHWDANTVAEYLDNTLSPEKVAEFEQTCLDQGPQPDMLLAETTSCHHVLTMVLGEPAEVDVQLRQRLYSLGQGANEGPSGTKLRIESAHQLGADQPEVAAPEPTASGATTEDHVPDYLRAAAAQRRGRRLMLGLAACLVVGGGLAFAFWPDGNSDEISNSSMGELARNEGRLRESAVDAANESETNDRSVDATSSGAEVMEQSQQLGANGSDEQQPEIAGGAVSEDLSPVAPPMEPANESPGAAGAEVVSYPSDGPPSSPSEEALELGPTLNDASQAVDAADDEDLGTVVQPQVVEESGNAVGGDERTEADAPVSEEPMLRAELIDSEPVDTEPDDLDSRDLDSGDLEAGRLAATDDLVTLTVPATGSTPLQLPGLPTDSSTEVGDMESALYDGIFPSIDQEDSELSNSVETPDEPAGPRSVGAYLGVDDVLLTFDSSIDEWVRMAAADQLVEGDQILTLPAFRAHVILGDMNAILGGGTQLILAAPTTDVEAPSDEGAAELRRGRLLLNAGPSGNRFPLYVGERRYLIELGASSSLAIELHIPYRLGGNSDSSSPPVVEWRLTSGSVEVEGPEGERTAQGAASWTSDGRELSPLDATKPMPAWIESEQVTDLERNARDQIALALEARKPVEITLLEFSDSSSRGRRRENRTLATSCSAFVGRFDPFVRALNDVDLKAYWSELLGTVREELAVDPNSVDQLRRAFRSLRGEDAAADLVQLTLGYDLGAVENSPSESQENTLRQLVRWLDSDQMAYRVLALHNIGELTGADGRGNYRPWHTASQRARSLRHYSDLDDLWTLVKVHSQDQRDAQ